MTRLQNEYSLRLGEAGSAEHLLKWRGSGAAEATWEPLVNCGVSWGVDACQSGSVLVYFTAFRQVAARSRSCVTRSQVVHGGGGAARMRRTLTVAPPGRKRCGTT